ncbi:hypothetical protein QFX18_19170 [Saccharophagus degradans]|uniref:hypothetical protein n=1 Tax=Saccharophagus degradans TaxID=86304 RepID=UPI002477F0FF|nr:hypothetical protein [Saccharophagus degradans]WGO98131.1 hypothetical protein QFX18_19170 [Saccharophagus degradans]
MKALIYFLGIFSSTYVFSVELCEEPDIKVNEAYKILSEYRALDEKNIQYSLESLSYNYVSCNWHAVYSIEGETTVFPEAHNSSYIYTFTNSSDIQMFKF